MKSKQTWTPVSENGGISFGPDFARVVLIKTLAEKGALRLNNLQESVPVQISPMSLAETVRDAALDGLVRVDDSDLQLTSLGWKVAENS